MKFALAAVLRPSLPTDILIFDHLTSGQIRFGDQHFDRFIGGAAATGGGGGGALPAGGQIRGDAAGGDSDTEYDKTRGFHYASLSTGWRA